MFCINARATTFQLNKIVRLANKEELAMTLCKWEWDWNQLETENPPEY